MGGSRPPWPCRGLAVLLLLIAASSSDARTLSRVPRRSKAGPSGGSLELISAAPVDSLANLAASESTPAASAAAAAADQMNVTTAKAELKQFEGKTSFPAGKIIILPPADRLTAATVHAAVAKANKVSAASAAKGVVRVATNTDVFESVLLGGRCLQRTEEQGIACMKSPNGANVVCLETGGAVVGYRSSNPVWAFRAPSPAADPSDELLLCLYAGNARLVTMLVGNTDVTELTVLYPGADYDLPRGYTSAAYIQDDANFVVYDPGCNALAQTGTPFTRQTPPPCLQTALDFQADPAYLADPGFVDPAKAGTSGGNDADFRWPEYYFKCPDGSFVTQYTYSTVVDAQGTTVLTGVTDLHCSDASSTVMPGWSVPQDENNAFPSSTATVSMPVGDMFFSPVDTSLLFGVNASVECRPGSLIAGMYGTFVRSRQADGGAAGGEALALICRSACTQELSSTGRNSDPLINCTSGVNKINKVGDKCDSGCGTGTLTVTCSALGQWNIDSQCGPMSSDTTSGAADGDRTRPNAATKRNYTYTCSPGTYIRGFPIVVDGSTREMLGIQAVQCSSADGTGSSSIPGWGVLTAANSAEVPYNLPNGFRRAEVHSLKDRGILRLAIPPNYNSQTDPIAAINPSWNSSFAACPQGTRAAGVYGKYIEGSFVSTVGFVCRKVCEPLQSEAATFGTCVAGVNVVGKVCSTGCPAGYTGTVRTTCTEAGVWQTASTCTADDLPCRGDPTPQIGASYDCDSTTTPKGSDCQGTCDAPNGYIGSISGTCQGAGNWSFTGSCDAIDPSVAFSGTTTQVMYPNAQLTQTEAEATCTRTGGRLVEAGGTYGCEHDSQVIYMGNKYHIVNRKALYGQATAQALCQKLGGNLSSFADVDENVNFLRELGFTTTDFSGLWIGLYALNPSPAKSSYTWISTGQTPDFPNTSPGGFWASGQPEGNYSCVKMASQYGNWADDECTKSYGFSCELAAAAVTCPAVTPAVETVETPSVAYGEFNCPAAKAGEPCVATCADGYVGAPRVQCSTSGIWGPVEGSCVQAANETVTLPNKRWTLYPSVLLNQRAARDFCAATGGKLITLKSADDTQALQTKLANYQASVWLGLMNTGSLPASASEQYVWLDTNQTPDLYRNWATVPGTSDEEPNGDMTNGEGFCVIADKDSDPAAQWRDKPCTDTYIVACEYLTECQGPLPTIAHATWGECTLPLASGLFCNATCDSNYEGSPTASCNQATWSEDGSCTPKACPPPELRPNADAFGESCNTAHESVCTATCVPFYEGSVNASCSFGNWTYGGECASTNCTAPQTSEPVGGFDCSNGQAKDSVCNATCSLGYSGSVVATCGANQQWSYDGTCTANGCSSPAVSPAPGNTAGNVSEANCVLPAADNSNCTVPCLSGHSGTVTVTCTLGSWTYADGVCTADPCNATPEANNATFSCSSTAAGESCTATCQDGFVASPETGAPIATCTAGQYQYSAGACVPQNCTLAPEDRANANTFEACDLAHGTVCTATCQAFYAGSVQATCAYGNWTYEDTCTSTNCTAGPENANPSSNQGYSCSNGLADGSVCDAECASGYEGAGLRATCTNTTWGYTGSCTERGCANAVVSPTPGNTVGNVSCETPVEPGTTCSVACSPGYSGEVNATCSLGTFGGVTGTCTGNPCTGEPPEINNATYGACTDGSNHGSTCSATCGAGYDPVETPGAICTAGEWVPTGGCVPQACGGAPEVQTNGGAFTSCNTTHGTTCTASCAPFYEGSVTATCSLGAWDYVNTCALTNCTSAPETTVEGAGGFDCSNGQAKDSVCTATCSPVYSGSVEATCGANQQWSYEGTCTPRGCNSTSVSPVPQGSSGAVDCANWLPVPHNTTCAVPCSADFAGTVTATCLFGQWQVDTTSGTCVRVAGTCSGTPTAWVDGGAFPPACASTRTNQSCTAKCNSGRLGTPTVQCVLDASATTGGRWSTNVAGVCLRACPGLPPQTLTGGVWPESCRDRTAFLGLCTGVCNTEQGYVGSPMVQCQSNGWSSTVVGGCRQAGAVCGRLPSIIVSNGRWPQSCLDTPDNATCTASCNAPRFGGSTPPRITCKATNGVAQWDASSLSGSCKRVCTSQPDASLLGSTGYWNGTCAGRVASGEVCAATCYSGYGSPTVRCTASGTWATTITGACQSKPVCKTPPTVNVAFGSWPDSCYNMENGKNCTGVCNSGFGTAEAPVATCVNFANNGTTGWVVQNPASLSGCNRICTGTPVASLLAGVGSWPTGCANRIAGQQCTGQCTSTYGTPTVVCTNSGWSQTVIGRCSDTPVCPGKPQPSIAAGVWPNSCADAAPGTSCNATCDYGSGGPNQPRVRCLNGTTPAWETTATGVCQKVCMGVPPSSLLPAGGSWQTACAGNTAVSGTCLGNCGANASGSPRVVCLGTGEWATSLVSGTSCTPI